MKPRILLVHSHYSSGPVSGENRVVEEETELLRAGGCDVHSWVPQNPSLGGLDTAMSAVWSRHATTTVRQLVETHRIQVVLVGNLFPMLSPAVIRVAKKAGAKVVYRLPNYRLLCLPATLARDGEICTDCVGKVPWRGVLRKTYRDSAAASGALMAALSLHRGLGTFSRIDSFLAVSEFVKKVHVQAGLPEERIWVRPNFANSSPRRVGPGEYFLFMGRLTREKGILQLANDWKPELGELLVVGSGPDAEALAGGSSRGVTLIPPVSPQEISGLVGRARAVLVPSTWYEPFGRVAVEAYAAGVPVIASAIGGLTEVVSDDESGFLVPPGLTPAWHEAVSKLNDDDTSRRLGEGAVRLWDRRYRPEIALAELTMTFERLISGT